ncbi:hypothetical protein ES703_14177 [subsurface metagenome]
MRTKDCEPLAKAISGITNTFQRRIVKAAAIRLLQPSNPLFDPDVFGKHVEDFHKEAESEHFKMVSLADGNDQHLLLAINAKDAALEALESLAWGICNHDGDVRECSDCGNLFDPEETDDPQNACCQDCIDAKN